MRQIIDMHSHLDFANDYRRIAEQTLENGIKTICSTTTPSSFVSTRRSLEGINSVDVSLGIHPWWIGDGLTSEVDIDRFCRLVDETPFIGEIGLDFGVRHEGSMERQLDAFARILDAISNKRTRNLITLHCVRSAGIVIDRLEELGLFDRNDIIFHWFSGTPDEFARACSKGSFFSVGMKMLATKAGRRYAKAIPSSLLLLESDSPAHEGTSWSIEIWRSELQGALRTMAELRDVDEEALASKIEENSLALLEGYGA